VSPTYSSPLEGAAATPLGALKEARMPTALSAQEGEPLPASVEATPVAGATRRMRLLPASATAMAPAGVTAACSRAANRALAPSTKPEVPWEGSVDTPPPGTLAARRRKLRASAMNSVAPLAASARPRGELKDAPAPKPSALPEPPFAPAKSDSVQGEKGEGEGVAEGVGVPEGVGPGVPEGEAPGVSDGVAVCEGEAEGHSSRRTVCPPLSVKNTPAAVAATPQGALSSAAPEAEPSAPPTVLAPATVATVPAAGENTRSRLLETSATRRFPAPSTERSRGLEKRAPAEAPSAQPEPAPPARVLTAAVAYAMKRIRC